MQVLRSQHGHKVSSRMVRLSKMVLKSVGHSSPLFIYFRHFKTVDSKQMFNLIFVDDWIWTADLRFQKQPLYQLSHTTAHDALEWYIAADDRHEASPRKSSDWNGLKMLKFCRKRIWRVETYPDLDFKERHQQQQHQQQQRRSIVCQSVSQIFLFLILVLTLKRRRNLCRD